MFDLSPDKLLVLLALGLVVLGPNRLRSRPGRWRTGCPRPAACLTA
jgi:hypothetical protein